MDTILKKLDMPKLYLWKLKDNPQYKYAVVDGQQRLNTIFRFLNNEFKLSAEYTPEYPNKNFNGLNITQKNVIHSYNLSIVWIKDANLDDIRDLFLRLQNGTTLRAAEKRVNLGGNMSTYIVKMSNHDILTKVQFGNNHRDFEQILAQCMMLELNKGPANTQNKFLNQMYIDEKDFDENGTVSRKFKKVLDYMNITFKSRTPELKKFNFINIYLLISQLDEFILTDKHFLFKEFLIDFWGGIINYRNQVNIDDNLRNPDLDDYIYAISSRTDSLESIKARHEIFTKLFLLKNPNLEIYGSV